MKVTTLIFSTHTLPKVSRHLLFWTAYTLYFFPQSIWFPETVDQIFKREVLVDAIVNFSCFMPVCIFSTYVSIYVLLPVFLKKKKYRSFIWSFLALSVLGLILNYFFSLIYYRLAPPKAEPTTFIGLLNLSYVNSMAAIFLSGISIGIKVTKSWYQQQQENLEIAKKKARTELRYQKARIQPEFLFQTLDSIHSRIGNGTADSSEMVLRLSDLLSYSLYNDRRKFVSLKHELNAVADFVFLEQRKQGDYLKIDLQTSESSSSGFVPPMIILALLNDSITVPKRSRDPQVLKVNIGSHNNWLEIRLTYSLGKGGSIRDSAMIINNYRKRLESFYPKDGFQLQMHEEGFSVIISVKIALLSRAHEIVSQGVNAKDRKESYEPA